MGRKYQFKRLAVSITFFFMPFFLLSAASPSSSGAQHAPFFAESIPVESIISNDLTKPIDGSRQQPRTFSLDEVAEFEAVSLIIRHDSSISGAQIAALVDGELIHRYELFQGSSLIVPGRTVGTVANLDGVTAVYLDELHQPQTDNSTAFIGAPQLWGQIGGAWNAGENTLFGTIDTGIWPEHPSFSDPDPGGRVYSPWRGGPLPCEFGNTSWNSNDTPFTCNGKLVGAYQFMDTYKSLVGLTPQEFDSARDSSGHGTHTTAIAAGNRRVSATINGISFGRVSGVAPRARIIVYKACGLSGCYSSDVVAAIEQAILDDVDVLNYAVSGGRFPYRDFVSLAFLRAYEEGVYVVRAAGNGGPALNSVTARDPWVTTVGASTQDRHFAGTLTLSAGSDSLTLEGVSITPSHSGRVVLASNYDGLPADDPEDGLCLEPFPAGTWSGGEIVVCERGKTDRAEKSYNVKQGGAGGLVLYNATPNTLAADNHFLPAIHIQNDEATKLFDFLASHATVNGTIESETKEASLGYVMAPFSGRGGPDQTLGISKPDLTAPGVQILAAHTPLPATPAGGKPGELFQILEGTSMAAAHVAGSALLLTQLHPGWTPGQIKSALMTTASTEQLLREDAFTAVNHFDAGSGHIDLTEAGDPGITISADAEAFRKNEAHLWSVNYPSVYVPNMPGLLIVDRELKSELAYSSTWNVTIESSIGFIVKAKSTMSFAPGETRTLSIIMDASNVPEGAWRQATIYLEEQTGNHKAHIPITIVRNTPPITVDNTCTPTNFSRLTTTSCLIKITNTTFETATVALIDEIPRRLRLIEGSLSGATLLDNKEFYFYGDLSGAEPPVLSMVDVTAPFPSYISLASLGLPTIDGVTDESIVNFSLPDYVFAGDTYDRIGMSSNGYAVVGGGYDVDISRINQSFPDTAVPNNVLAPFWTDLNPMAGGNMYIGFLVNSATGETWVVMEWENVPNYDDGMINTFQIWLGLSGAEEIYYTYDTVSNGNMGLVTVGAENESGNAGVNWLFNGTGTPVASGDVLRVFSNLGAFGETHEITFQMTGWVPGQWKNCAFVGSSAFKGIYPACESGQILP